MTVTIASMPAYNEEWYLARIVPGCKKYMDEVVMVYDGNTDATPGVYA